MLQLERELHDVVGGQFAEELRDFLVQSVIKLWFDFLHQFCEPRFLRFQFRLVDGSVFPRLPSRGLTFTMMANADRIGRRIRDRLMQDR